MSAAPCSIASFEALLERWLPAYGLVPAPPLRARLAHYLQLVHAGNARVRLVGDAAPETLVRRHLGESLVLGPRLLGPPPPPGANGLIDVGSGAGFPGLPLALAYPDIKTTLVEATGKKAAFLREAVQALHLTGQVAVANLHLPVAAALPWAPTQLLTCRALDHMPAVPDWIFSLLGPGGTAAFWVSRTLAATWRLRYPQFAWGEPALLPFADQRALVLATIPAGPAGG